jgi:hypothetical protein
VQAQKSNQAIGAQYEGASKSIRYSLANLIWYNREQIGYHSRASKAHLTSGQHIAYKRSSNREYQYHHAR